MPPERRRTIVEFFNAYAVQLQILEHIALAMLMGAVVGLEREFADKPAGLRTHMLVAGAAALLVSLGTILVQDFETEMQQTLVRSDPLRIIEAVITGVSFLGAGTIIRRNGAQGIQGLTTAASILFVAAIGMTIALSQLMLAAGVTVLLLVTLRLVRIVERRFKS
jgi:putative Mg2+ transporter-C (MgtC) family protein